MHPNPERILTVPIWDIRFVIYHVFLETVTFHLLCKFHIVHGAGYVFIILIFYMRSLKCLESRKTKEKYQPSLVYPLLPYLENVSDLFFSSGFSISITGIWNAFSKTSRGNSDVCPDFSWVIRLINRSNMSADEISYWRFGADCRICGSCFFGVGRASDWDMLLPKIMLSKIGFMFLKSCVFGISVFLIPRLVCG